jgi:hypothetical protein
MESLFGQTVEMGYIAHLTVGDGLKMIQRLFVD